MRRLDTTPRSILVACSGGLDSVVLLEILWRLRVPLQLTLRVAHVHHGLGNSRFRRKAWLLVRQHCEEKGLEFLTNSPDGNPPRDLHDRQLKSEAELRHLRRTLIEEWREACDADAVATAHHYRDLLETRLIRLARGTGRTGLTSMRIFDGGTLRPLLMIEKCAVEDYARGRDLNYVDDPTNRKPDAFRNWMRRWLLQLDRKQPNGTRNLARSLNELAEELDIPRQLEVMTGGGIDRMTFFEITRAQQRSALARYCRQMGLKNYTQGHIEELVKRLDDRQKQFTFELLRCVWSVTPDRIKASREDGRV